VVTSALSTYWSHHLSGTCHIWQDIAPIHPAPDAELPPPTLLQTHAPTPDAPPPLPDVTAYPCPAADAELPIPNIPSDSSLTPDAPPPLPSVHADPRPAADAELPLPNVTFSSPDVPTPLPGFYLFPLFPFQLCHSTPAAEV
jgi:hypothetical protein